MVHIRILMLAAGCCALTRRPPIICEEYYLHIIGMRTYTRVLFILIRMNFCVADGRRGAPAIYQFGPISPVYYYYREYNKHCVSAAAAAAVQLSFAIIQLCYC